MTRSTHTNKALTDICRHLAEWELTDEEIKNLAADLPGEMEQFAKCEDCGVRSRDLDEAGRCQDCHDAWAQTQWRDWKSLYDGEVLAGLHRPGGGE
jgi:predicted Zn-ribbon and HTH transcriptional regulator